MKCKRIQQYLLDYSEQLLDQENHHLVEEHLRHCPECAKELQEIEQTIRLLQTLPVQSPPETFWPDFTSNVMRQIRKMEPVPSRLRDVFFFPHAKLAVAVFIALLVIGGGWTYYFRHVQSTQHLPELASQHSENLDKNLAMQQAPGETPDIHARLGKIASDELIYDMLDSEFGFFERGNPGIFDADNSPEWLYFLIRNLSDEEKDRLLLELYKLK
ncbi:putative transmembrane anti-sigma factor [Candidatus Vecturithrix granuli]|uniref:Putative transmembrane anti-sigma factor n=1 Tax=Vecturithrix granuli TaxID=1499967 RepID=A0A081C9E3_VECG1|nr:putative transmembrane anti-sigma factor [Candidatus Vecturithrix granuli]